jgi:hypothetical protein
MNTSYTSFSRPALGVTALIALGCAFSLAFVPISAKAADDTAALQPLADKAPSLPLTATFEKVSGAENGPFVLHLKNVSKDAIKASAKVLLSVVVHNTNKARVVPEHVVAPGEVWTIADLAALDKVIVTAEGFAPLELTVHSG